MPRNPVLEIEVIGSETLGPGGPLEAEVKELCALAFSSAGIESGHAAVQFVDEERIRDLNRRHRGVDVPTDVLSFGIDESGVAPEPRELGDVVICPPCTHDIREAVLHGALHLTGMDHESDGGEMLALQAELMRWVS